MTRAGIGEYVARAIRLIAGAAVATLVALALTSPDLPTAAAVAGAATLLISLWRPDIGLLLVAGLTPAGRLLAAEPVHCAELITWAFLAGWLLRAWRPLSPTGWPRTIVIPALLYMACVLTSWLALTIGDAGGIDPAALPRFVVRAFGTDHLAATSPEPETITMLLALAGGGLLLAAIALTREVPTLARRVGMVLVASMTLLSLTTLTAVFQHLASRNFAGWLLYQYVTSERMARHLPDVNAAAAQYLLAALIAVAFAVFDTKRRWLWAALVVLMAPAAALTGSRSAAITGVAIGVLTLARARGPIRLTRTQITAVATVIVVVLVAGGVILARGANQKEAAGRAARLRLQFSETSARMFTSAPLFGVGVGRYHGRSGDFMPTELRDLYGHENAHNYFAQQFAELGLVGGGLFLWLALASIRAAWKTFGSGDATAIALSAAAIAYLVTCVTGHPLLVAEATFPFWAVLGGAIGSAVETPAGARSQWPVFAVRGVGLALIALLITAAASYSRETRQEHGFYEFERLDGRPFRWTTRHANTYIRSSPGFLTLTVRAAATEAAGPEPFELVTEIDGAQADRRVIAADRWTTIEIPVRPRRKATAQYRRVDLRVNRTWTRSHRDGRRNVSDPVGVMVAETQWTPAR